ncbi:MAG: DUF1822 family protein [Cyanobacteria bacterium P01_D01_bin.56]
MRLAFAEPTEWWLEVPPNLQTECWRASQALVSPLRRQDFYLNQLCVQSFLPWFQLNYAPTATLWCHRLPSIGEVVNGSSITLASKRIVLLPTDTFDSEDLEIPQEWVDIPGWAADYYFAIQIGLEEGCARVWGYTTHKTIKQQADYDGADRTYCMQGKHVMRDLTTFWPTYQLCPEVDTMVAIAPLSPLSQTQAEHHIQHLSQPDVVFPRLAIPFEQWATLINQQNWRQQLYQRRLASLGQEIRMANAGLSLNQWFHDLQTLFEQGWYSLETVLGTDTLSLSFRTVSPTNAAQQQRVKLITLNAEFTPQTMVLLMALTAETDGRVGVRVQLHASTQECVPAQLSLSIYSVANEMLQSIQTSGQEDYIRLPYFRCIPGYQFRLQVTLNNDVFSETYTV